LVGCFLPWRTLLTKERPTPAVFAHASWLPVFFTSTRSNWTISFGSRAHTILALTTRGIERSSEQAHVKRLCWKRKAETSQSTPLNIRLPQFQRAADNHRQGAGTGRPCPPAPAVRHPPLFLFFGIRQALLDAISHALIRLCDPKQKLLGAIVCSLICFGAAFPELNHENIANPK
jgi:hypothetical protein